MLTYAQKYLWCWKQAHFGTFWTFGIIYTIIDLIWFFGMPYGSFLLVCKWYSIYKWRQWVIWFLDPVGNYKISDVILSEFHRLFVTWCMQLVDMGTCTNSMIVHHVANISMMYINIFMLSLAIWFYVIYLY